MSQSQSVEKFEIWPAADEQNSNKNLSFSFPAVFSHKDIVVEANSWRVDQIFWRVWILPHCDHLVCVQ